MFVTNSWCGRGSAGLRTRAAPPPPRPPRALGVPRRAAPPRLSPQASGSAREVGTCPLPSAARPRGGSGAAARVRVRARVQPGPGRAEAAAARSRSQSAPCRRLPRGPCRGAAGLGGLAGPGPSGGAPRAALRGWDGGPSLQGRFSSRRRSCLRWSGGVRDSPRRAALLTPVCWPGGSVTRPPARSLPAGRLREPAHYQCGSQRGWSGVS